MTNKKTVDEKLINGMNVDQAIEKYEFMVQKFVNSANTNSVCNRDDLVQEGRMAIVLAFQKFDESKGASFTTWVYHMIKDLIAEYQKRNLSYLSGGSYLRNKIKKIGTVSVDKLVDSGLSRETAIAATALSDSFIVANLDSLSDIVADNTDQIDNLINTFEWKLYLSDTEIYAIDRYFGIDSPQMTMKEIGENLNKSRKAVSYLINKALVKLRHVPGIEAYIT